MFNLPNKNGDIDKGIRFSDKDPDIIKPEYDIIIYLPLPEDVYKVNEWRVRSGVMEVRISRINS